MWRVGLASRFWVLGLLGFSSREGLGGGILEFGASGFGV